MTIPKIQKDPAISFFTEWVRPRATALDQNPAALREALGEMAGRGLMGMRVPVYLGGKGTEDKAFRQIQETAARCSGAFAFLQAQHQSAGSMLAQSQAGPLREKYLPKLASGEIKSGVAFSQLRRPGRPVLTATPVADGYKVEGNAPWVTGWGLFTHCVTAAALPYGRTLFFLHELKESSHLKASLPMKLAAFESTQTVSVKFTNLNVIPADVLYIQASGWINDNDLLNVVLQAPFALGCARAGIDVMRDVFSKKKIDSIQNAADALEKEFKKCREEAYASMDSKTDAARGLKARGWAIELALRCTAAAVASASGAGNSLDHAAQRVYREALVFAVSAQTEAVMGETLERLIRK